ncbi:MAG: fumarate hydratase [Deltaproteobacteria bacterium]|nr:fumarate hydratase [Deltaproteobacteria bacterium]
MAGVRAAAPRGQPRRRDLQRPARPGNRLWPRPVPSLGLHAAGAGGGLTLVRAHFPTFLEAVAVPATWTRLAVAALAVALCGSCSTPGTGPRDAVELTKAIHDVNPDPRLGALEADVLSCANRLGIGPMGFGGRTTLLAVKVAGLHRLPASFYVTVGYMCWACRRASVTIEGRNVKFSQHALAGRSRRAAG